MTDDIIPAAPELATGSPTEQIMAATLALHTWLMPRIETRNSVPVSHAELERIRFLLDCVDRATHTIASQENI